MSVFQARLKAAREKRGLNQSELASKLGTDASAINHFEGGRRKPSFESIKALSKSLHVTADYLLGIDSGTTAFRGEDLLTDTDRKYIQGIIDMMISKKEDSQEK